MSEAPATYLTLPEDLEPLRNHLSDRSLTVTLGRGPIFISRAAHEALGSPRRVDVLLGAASRMLALRPVEDGGYTVTTEGYAFRVGSPTMVKRLGLPPATIRQPRRFAAHLVEGALLVGPLPRGEES